MRLRLTLLQVAVLASTGCGGSTSDVPATGEAGATDAAHEAGEPEAACGGCGCNTPSPTNSGNATSSEACAMAAQVVGDLFTQGPACQAFCTQLNDGGHGDYLCSLPQAYVTAFQQFSGDGGAGPSSDAGSDAGAGCPAWSGDVVVQCGYPPCLGRRTDGIADPARCGGGAPGELLAERAYLEAVSVHAFARLERELAAHGATPALLREVRRARRDEIRHTAMMARLARRLHARVTLPEKPPATPVRSLLAIALENAIEGCVRETYGAVGGLLEARESGDLSLRRAMRSIGEDECRHAELAWAVAAWIRPRLTLEEREAVDRAIEETVATLSRQGNPRIVRLLASRVWRASPAEALSA